MHTGDSRLIRSHLGNSSNAPQELGKIVLVQLLCIAIAHVTVMVQQGEHRLLLLGLHHFLLRSVISSMFIYYL